MSSSSESATQLVAAIFTGITSLAVIIIGFCYVLARRRRAVVRCCGCAIETGTGEQASPDSDRRPSSGGGVVQLDPVYAPPPIPTGE